MNYPLQIVHQFEMTAAEAVETAALVAFQSKTSLERTRGISKKRGETLAYAGIVLRALVERLGFERVVVSAYGLREGLLFEAMSREVAGLDPLVEGCAALGARHGVTAPLGSGAGDLASSLWAKLDPVFPGREPTLLAAACRLADLGARLHPDHRADLVFDQVLRAPIPGQSHPERAFLATAMFRRYTGERVQTDPSVGRVLSPERMERAEALGAALRLGCDLSGRSPKLLAASTLSRSKGELTLEVKRDAADLLLGEQTSKRAEGLAKALGLELKVRVR